MPEPDLPTIATVSFLFIEKLISFNIWFPVSYEKLISLNSILPLILLSFSPASCSISWSSWSNISLAAANPFCTIIFIFDNCLIGFAIKPAAVKNATNVSASNEIPNLAPNAK